MDHNTEVDAIQEDVSIDENRPLSARERAMEAISQKHIANLSEEVGIDLSGTKQVEEQLAEPEPDPAPVEEPQVQKVKVKVDGAEQEVDLDTLVRTFQKNSAADRRLEEATRLLREAEELTAAKTAQPSTPTEQPKPETTPEELRQAAADVLGKLYDGDQEAAADALAQLLAKQRGGDQPTPPAPQAAIDDEALLDKLETRMTLRKAFETVKTDYPDIIADPDLELLTANKIERAIAAGVPRAEAMINSAKEVYALLGKTPAGRPTDEPKPSPADKRRENKERLDPIPTAHASATPAAAPMEANNPSAIIAELASRRPGQSLPRPAS